MALTIPYPFELVLVRLDQKYREMVYAHTRRVQREDGVSTKAYKRLVAYYNYIQKINAERRFWAELEQR